MYTGLFGLVPVAYDAGRKGGILPAVMNAANEVAVNAFLKGKSGFTDIERIVKAVYSDFDGRNIPASDLDTVLQADREARIKAGELIG